MPYSIAADLIVVVHFGFILFVVFGGLFVARHPVVAWAHVPAAVWGALLEFAGWICPLTPLENRLRTAAGSPRYGGSFVEHYILPLVYPEALTRDVQVMLGVFVVLLNLAVYWSVLATRRKGRSRFAKVGEA